VTPINTSATTVVLGKPRDWDDEKMGSCGGLPIHRTDDAHQYSWWQLSWRERWWIVIGRPVRLCVIGRGHPPVSLAVVKSGE